MFVSKTATEVPSKNISEIAQEVLAGTWGNGSERKEKLTNAGYDYDAVQAEVNKILNQESDCIAPDQEKYFSVSIDGKTYSGTLTEK